MTVTITTPAPSASTKQRTPSENGLIAALVVGAIAPILDSTIVTIALRKLASALHESISTIQWVSTGYLLAMAMAIPISGWAQGRFGARRTWMVALGLFGGGSVLCATAWSGDSLIAFRVLQGLGGGLIFPLMSNLAVRAAGADRTRIIARITMPVALGPILGPVLGGVVLNWLEWRWLFLINVPVIAVALVLARTQIPADDDRARSADRLDLIGLLLAGPGLAAILLSLTNLANDGDLHLIGVGLPLAAGIVLIACFALRAVRGEQPLINLRLLSRPSLASSAGSLFCAGAAMYAATFLLPLYWQEVRGKSLIAAAFLLVPQGIGALAARTVVGKLSARLGARVVTVGSVLVVLVATVPFALATGSTSVWWLGAVLLVRGVGVGAVLIPPMTVAYVDVEAAEAPHATMVTRIAQQVGASFGVAVVALALQTSLTHGAASAMQHAFWWAIGVTAVALIPAALMPSRSH